VSANLLYLKAVQTDYDRLVVNYHRPKGSVLMSRAKKSMRKFRGDFATKPNVI
jgi:hypothetical protein